MNWQQLAINFLVSTLISELLRPKVKQQGIGKPAGLGDFTVPTASETRPVPVIWGRRKHTSPNVIWMGDLGIEEVKEKVRTGLFSSESVVKGYNYRVGLQFALCHGTINRLYSVQASNKDLYRSESGTYSIGAGFYISGTLGDGSSTQTIRSLLAVQNPATGSGYMTAQQPLYPRYPGKTIINWFGPSLASDNKSGLVGQTPNIPALEFEVLRLPEAANFTPSITEPPKLLYLTADEQGPTHAGGPDIVMTTTRGQSANPAACLWELLTNTNWGAGLPTDLIDADSFADASKTLAREANGVNIIWDNTKSIEEMKEELERQMNGALYTDPTTGKLTLTLIRETNPVAAIFDESNIAELVSFSKTASPDATNEVRLNYEDSSANFKQRVAILQDFGAIAELGNASINSSNIDYPGITNATLASQIATRDLRQLSGSLAKATISVLQTPGLFIKPTDKVVISYADLGIVNMTMRVLAAKYNAGLKGEIELELVEDIFDSRSFTFTVPAAATAQSYAITQYTFRAAAFRTAADKAKIVVVGNTAPASQLPRIGYRAAWSSTSKPYSESQTETSIERRITLTNVGSKTVVFFNDAGQQQTKTVIIYEVRDFTTNALITEPDGAFMLNITTQTSSSATNGLFKLNPETTAGRYTLENAEGFSGVLWAGNYYLIKGYAISPEYSTTGFSEGTTEAITIRGTTETVFGSPFKEIVLPANSSVPRWATTF